MFRFRFVLSLLAVSCTEKVSFDTTETARAQARENGEYVAQKYRADNTAYVGYDIYVRGDSTISRECPQGDGWASVDLRNKKGQTKVRLKCSTVSVSIGCMTSQDFKSKRYATQDGKCNKEIPHPLPKLVK